MTQKLRDYPAELLALAQLVADHFSISRAYVEKDFWVIKIRRAPVSGSNGEAHEGVQLKWQDIRLAREKFLRCHTAFALGADCIQPEKSRKMSHLRLG